MKKLKREQQLATQCVDKARAMMGNGWDHISADLRWGLVAANVLAILDAQDESIPPARVVALTKAIMAAARADME